MSCMHKTQIYLDDLEYHYVKDLAKSTSKSMTQLIRDWVREHIRARQNTAQTTDPFFKICGIAQKEKSDIATNFDTHLYGTAHELP